MTIRDITFAISDISDVSDIIPFIFWVAFAKKGQPYNILGWFFFISGLIKIFTLVTAELHIHNLPAYHLLAFLEVTFVYGFYRLLASRKINYWLVLTVLILYTGNTFIQNINETFNSNTWTLTVLLILFIGLSYFYHIYKSADEITPLAERPDFIITAGWLIYASGSLFTYLMGTDILSGYAGGFFKNAWLFECVSNIIKNTMICFGFWLTGRR